MRFSYRLNYKNTIKCYPTEVMILTILTEVYFKKTTKEIFASDVTRPWEYREKQLQGLIKFLDTEKEAIFKGMQT